jgi:hypothetical protein
MKTTIEMAREAGFDITIDPTELRCFVEAWEDQLKTFEALVRADERLQALAAPVQKRPPNCGTGYCSCVECVMEPAAQQEPINVAQAYAMAQVCLDLHDALGCKWGDNPYLAIDRLKTAAPIPDAITDNSESPDFRAGWNECRELTIQMRKS